MQCPHFDAHRCRSCALMGTPHAEQLAGKETLCRQLLADHPGIGWLPAVAGAESGFRNKAKMVVGGTVDSPSLGILDRDGRGVDLSDCGLYPDTLQAAFPALTSFITRAGLEPYDVPGRRGELKYFIVTQSPAGELMLRIVVRDETSLPGIRAELPWLLAALPQLKVVSANLHPEHKAVLEGEIELPLTEQQQLPMTINGVPLRLRPRSFFQTNTEIAAALYREAVAWTDALGPDTVWDLYCGVGGFALHLARPGRDVLGVEAGAEAVQAATDAAAALDVPARFVAADATGYALSSAEAPELVVVNPPRRGIGDELAGWLEASGAGHVLYSSCNAVSLAKDLAAMPSLRPVKARVFDMFPQTHHYEVLTLLQRR